jgi:hypothetical protein
MQEEPRVCGRGRAKYAGDKELAYASILTFMFFLFGCWWSLPCTIIGIILAITVCEGCRFWRTPFVCKIMTLLL